jgi:hypothetical protein
LNNIADHIQIGDKTVAFWDEKWAKQGLLTKINLSELYGYFGVYRIVFNKEVVYIGKASEYSKHSKRGFHKRLGDYTRNSGSSKSSKKIHANKNKLYIETIIIGSDKLSSILADMLEAPLLVKHHPKWNTAGKKQD